MKVLDYGFVACTGKQWTDEQVDSYNRLSEEIEQKPDNEALKDMRHNVFCSYSDTLFFAVC